MRTVRRVVEPPVVWLPVEAEQAAADTADRVQVGSGAILWPVLVVLGAAAGWIAWCLVEVVLVFVGLDWLTVAAIWAGRVVGVVAAAYALVVALAQVGHATGRVVPGRREERRR